MEEGDGQYASSKRAASFYFDADKNGAFSSTRSLETDRFEYLKEADRVGGDCSKTEKPCAHVLPEYWGNYGSTEIAAQSELEGRMYLDRRLFYFLYIFSN